MADASPITVHILDKDYRIGCPEDERDALFVSARYLDQKMREIRDGGRVIGTDRIAVMAALNIAHELLQVRDDKENSGQSLARRIKHLQEKIDLALSTTKQLEL